MDLIHPRGRKGYTLFQERKDPPNIPIKIPIPHKWFVGFLEYYSGIDSGPVKPAKNNPRGTIAAVAGDKIIGLTHFPPLKMKKPGAGSRMSSLHWKLPS
jgi:hypothetical protein